MKRRDLIVMLVGAVVAGPAAHSASIARLGFLGFCRPSDWSSQIAAFRAGLRDAGYVEGKL
jgi:putative tryptophan/tyrosine transport system substrate-binding protein